jgi:hypothetical protein
MATIETNIGAGFNPIGPKTPTFRTDPSKYTTIDQLVDPNAPDVRDYLVKTYGDQGITGFLTLTGAVKNAGTNDFITYYEEGRRHSTITVGANVDFDEGATGTLDLGDAGDVVLGLQDVVMNSGTGEVFIVTGVSTTGVTEGQVVFTTMDGANASNWTSGQKLILIGNVYAQGSDQPDHFRETAPQKRNNNYMIVKETFQVNGSQATNIGYVNVGNGDYRWYIYGEQETRKRFMDKREMMMLFAEQKAAGAPIGDGVSGSEGYFAAIANRGITVSGASSNPLDSISEFDNIILELDKQGAPAEYAMYLNRKQSLAIDDMLAGGIATQVTAGLAGQFGAFNNNPDMAVQLGFKSFTRGGYTFHKHDWKLLNDPTLLGASNQYQGAMIPMATVVDPVTATKAPALELNYKAANGYSREMEHWVTGGGVLGFNQNTKDTAEFHYRSEIALVTRAANQHVAIKG